MIENPTAFPCQEIRSGGFGIRESSDGMSLRDWFAGQALAGICAARTAQDVTERGCAEFADASYVIADAMLAARKGA